MPIQDVRPQDAQTHDGLAVLYGLRIDQLSLIIKVVSFGCTNASNFSVELESVSADTFRLAVVVQKPDLCRMRAHIVTLMLDVPPIPDPATARFLVMNRFATPDLGFKMMPND
jgi:hypothetical protein